MCICSILTCNYLYILRVQVTLPHRQGQNRTPKTEDFYQRSHFIMREKSDPPLPTNFSVTAANWISALF